MAKDSSFDIECQFDLQEIKNAVDQAKREVATRYDFKDVLCEIKLGDDTITITTESDFKMIAIKEIINSKMVKRNQSPKVLDWSKTPEKASGMNIRQEIKLIKALEQEDMKKMNKLIKENFKKVKSSIQGETVRVSSASKNDLQEAMQLIKKDKSIDAPISFTNFR